MAWLCAERFQHSVLTEQDCVFLDQITEAQVSGWLRSVQTQPTTTGEHRAESTICSYARSVRAFCRWAVQKKYLLTTPFAHLPLPNKNCWALRTRHPSFSPVSR